MLELLNTNTLLAVLLFAFLAAFIVDTISNMVEFDHKISNALASALVFIVLAGGLAWYVDGDYVQVLIYAALLFVADYIGNLVLPSPRLLNALATGVLFAISLFLYLAFLA